MLAEVMGRVCIWWGFANRGDALALHISAAPALQRAEAAFSLQSLHARTVL